MIKFFQKLKAKKGFTLVELIVVIAIIGVLAAILIPTMLGYVTNSRVTSADSTAASIKNNIDTFLTNADTAGYGMLKGDSNDCTFTAKISGGQWNVSVDDDSCFKSAASGKSWSTTATTVSAGKSKGGVTAAEGLLGIELADLFPEMKSGVIVARLTGGKCVAVAYTADSEDATKISDVTGNMKTGGWNSAAIEWDKSTAGVNDNGLIVGTAPKLPIG